MLLRTTGSGDERIASHQIIDPSIIITLQLQIKRLIVSSTRDKAFATEWVCPAIYVSATHAHRAFQTQKFLSLILNLLEGLVGVSQSKRCYCKIVQTGAYVTNSRPLNGDDLLLPTNKFLPLNFLNSKTKVDLECPRPVSVCFRIVVVAKGTVWTLLTDSLIAMREGCC